MSQLFEFGQLNKSEILVVSELIITARIRLVEHFISTIFGHQSREHIGGKDDIYPAYPLIFDVSSLQDLETKLGPKKLVHTYSALNHVSKGDAPVYLTYTTSPPEGPYSKTERYGVSIHSAKFGELLCNAYSQLGLEAYLKHPKLLPSESEVDFIIRHLGK